MGGEGARLVREKKKPLREPKDYKCKTESSLYTFYRGGTGKKNSLEGRKARGRGVGGEVI